MRVFHFRSSSRFAAVALLVSTCFGAAALAAGDVEDQFFRYIQRNHKSFAQELPGESVDPFSGILRVVQVDLALPGKAGLDLQILRTYNSKIWGRTDGLDMEPLLAEKEHSPLGYGWSMHMGRVKNPNAAGELLACHQVALPVYEAPDGTARVFYPVTAGSPVLVSKDYWRMEKNCSALGGAGVCIWSDKGVRYEFASSNQYFYATTPVWPLSRIVDRFNNTIIVSYVAAHGEAVAQIVDSYARSIAFAYQTADDGLRLSTMTVNGAQYLYSYTLYTGAQTGGTGRIPLPGAGRLFLTAMKPPVGPSFLYSYAQTAPVAQNQYALAGITYPSGGTANYTYGTTSFYTGSEFIPFAVVTRRTLGGRAVAPGTWSYGYSSPGPGTALQTATIQRPDGKADSYSMYGFGYVAGKNATGFAWMAGLTQQVSLASGAEVQTNQWDARTASPITSAYPYGTPIYSSTAQCPTTAFDNAVYSPVLTRRTVSLDGATYSSTFSSFDAYGQAQSVSESGQQSRSTTWTFLSAPTTTTGTTLNMVRGFPLTQQVCVGTDCFDNSWTYNAPNRARDAQTLSGVKTTFTYDPTGNLSTVTNPLGQKLTVNTWTNGVPSSINFNGAFNVSRLVRFEGWITSETDGRGNTTTYGYDSIGRLGSMTPPGTSSASTYVYAADGSAVTLTRGTYSQVSTLDGLGRVIATRDSEGVLASTKYDALGRATFRSYPYDSAVGEVGDLITSDGLGRPLSVKKAWRPATSACDDANACTTTYAYSGNCITRTVDRKPGESPSTKQCSASFGDPEEQRLTSATDANASVWSYAYSAHGDLKTVGAPAAAGNRTYAYFPTTNFLQSETTAERFDPQAPSQPSIAYTRNAIGQPLTKKDARGITATLGYDDPLSRLTSTTYAAGVPSATRGALSYGYDEVNRPTQERWSYGGRTYTTGLHYTPGGCLDTITYPTGTILTQTCDSDNRVTSVSIGTSTIATAVTYHPSGHPTAMTYGNGKAATLTFDDRARVKTITSVGIVDLSYTYDGADNVKSFDNLAVAGSSRTMTYDNLDRLLTATAPSLWGTATYDYDALGNRTLNSYNGFTASYTYDAHNRLATVKAGSARDTNMRFVWDAANHLASSSDGATYFYDGLGRRIEKTDSSGTTLYHYDPAGRLLSETDGQGQKVRDYIYLAGKLIAVDGCIASSIPPCSERQWYSTDALGTVLARADATGTVTGRFEYKPWGEQWSTPAPQGDRQYNGRVYDQGTGFHDYGARMYWPQIGRFISADSYQGDIANSASLNRYSYVHSNPYKYTDPSGHCPWCVAGAIIGGVVGAGGGVWYAIDHRYSWRSGKFWASVGIGAGSGALVGGTMGLAGTALAGGGGAAAAGTALTAEGAAAPGVIQEMEAAAPEVEAAGADAVSTWGNGSTLTDHFVRHGADVGASTEGEYATAASDFLVRSQAEKLPTKIDSSGIIRVYDAAKNLFGAYNADGTTRTLFSPSSGAQYFDKQPGSLVGGQ